MEGGDRALAKTLEEVEKRGLYLAASGSGRGEKNGWEDVVESVVKKAVGDLESAEKRKDKEKEELVELVGVCTRLNWGLVEDSIPKVLGVFATTSSTTSSSSNEVYENYLQILLLHHTRSLTLPSFLGQLSSALSLSSSSKGGRNMLNTLQWQESLGKAIKGLVGSGVNESWGIVCEGLVEKEVEENGENDGEEDGGRKKKRRKLETTVAEMKEGGKGERVGLMRLFIRSIDNSFVGKVDFDLIKSTTEKNLKEIIKSSKSKSKGKSKSKSGEGEGEGREWLRVWYDINSRFIRLGEREKVWELEEKRRKGLREVVESDNGGGEVVEAVSTFSSSLRRRRVENSAD